MRLLEEARFDVLISDIALPDGSGYDVMRAAQARQGLPCIALSGFGMEEDIHRGMEAGFSHYLTKPVDFQDLEMRLRNIASSEGKVAAKNAR